MTRLRTEAAALLPELTALRRDLHREPEIGLDLPLTQRKVLDALDGLPLEITLGQATTSVTAVLRGGHPGPVVLLRGDMDGLPVAEETGLDYAGTNGNMHACGHDLHTAGLVGAAKLLAARADEIHGSVVFMFQPGEEGYKGAKVMLDEGLLDVAGQRPIAAYGIHVAPGPRGTFSIKSGPALAGSNTLEITVTGKGGHGSQPQTAVDPVPALLAIASELQTMVTRRFSVFDPVVLSVTQLQAGEAINVIPAQASLGATVRTLSPESVETMRTETTRLAAGIASAHGCTAEVDFEVQYPVTVNTPEQTDWVAAELRGLFGEERIEIVDQPLMGSEDFSFVLEEVPGTFFFLHCSPDGLDPATAAWNHSPHVLFDDAVLADEAAALAHLALTRLAG
ncbi:hippurate hydrolase [Brevibacterium sanguinis]|uniref:Hippurate hydrolase n=2 Tax=Brevibacterium TaxID=1696 RepID=A0A366ID96_9MICO|nr:MULTISPECIES: M20 family metallopeptidase [Brevibacterium]RBP61905.1 hippurate hydrolase [Brevibacterium sanguinis]RBP68649.1 hippurate hydrolase [Brevibacterium celere]